jgi:hypothetical protein
VLQERLTEHGRWGAEIGTALIFLGIACVANLVFYRLHRRYLEHTVFALSLTTWYLLLVSIGEVGISIGRSPHSAELDLTLAKWLNPAIAVYGWFAVRRFNGVSRNYATLATVVLFPSGVLISMALNITVIAFLIVTA